MSMRSFAVTTRRHAAVLSLAILAVTTVGSMAAEPTAPDAEAIFADASRYTVRVRTAVRWPLMPDSKGSWSGAGFLVDRERGWLVTNAHVSGTSPGKIDVAFKDRDYVPAKAVFVDTHLDLAVLAISAAAIPANATVAQLDCGASPAAGTPVGAFGHPWSMKFSATRGIVSGRRFQFGTEKIQTDAPVNHGNSGGPLISMTSGKVVGVAASMLKKTVAEGIGFAVPADFTCHILDLMRAGRDPSAPDIGIAFAGNGQRDDLVVAHVAGPEWAALKTGDRVVAVNGNTAILNPSQLIDHLRGRDGAAIFTVMRNRERVAVDVTPGRDPLVTKRDGVIVSGMLVAPPARRDAAEINRDGRLMIHYVDQGSPANMRNARGGDVLWSVNGRQFSDVDAFWTYLTSEPRPKKLSMILRRTSASNRVYFDFQQLDLAVEDLSRLRGNGAS